MSNQNSETTPAMQQAVWLLQQGLTVQAEETVVAAAREAAELHGVESHEHAVAQNELGSILINVEQFDRAADAFQAACAGPWPTDEGALRDRLTFLTNLALACQLAGRQDQAEQALRDSVTGRRDYYGADHAGYAFGLEPLGEFLMRQGRLSEALPVIHEAVTNFWNNEHPRIATALALRAEALRMAHADLSPFAHLEGLPDELVAELARSIVGRVDQAEPLVARDLLAVLIDFLPGRLGEDHPALGQAIARAANLERELGEQGDPHRRVSLIRRAVELADRQGQAEAALQGLQGLALALEDAGQPEEAVAVYDEALTRVRALENPALESQVLRNYGLMLSGLDRREEAEARLQEAVETGARSGNSEMLGRAQVALGIRLQHAGSLSEAETLLRSAVQLLDAAHPDSVCGRSHLRAIETGAGCGCGDPRGAIAEAFREFVLAQLPADLLERLDVTLTDDDFELGVHLNREPTEAEIEHLNRVLQHALTEFRQRLSSEA